ncbi:hypothetical protein CEXT_10161, partial [Caerostris extrusa]
KSFLVEFLGPNATRAGAGRLHGRPPGSDRRPAGSSNIRGRPAASLICKRYQTTSALRNLFMSFTSPPDPDLGFPDCSGDRVLPRQDSFQDRALCVAAGCHGN